MLTLPAMRPLRGRKALKGLGLIWAGVVVLHLILRLPDIRLWLAVPLLILPWWLFGPDWFEP